MKKKIIIIFYTIITLIFFGMLIKMEYATDTYSVFNFNAEQIYMQFAMSGRFITAIIGKFVKIINISEKTIYISSWIMAVTCTILSQYKLYTIIEKDVKTKVLKLLIPTIIIINAFSIELFLFIEKGIMCFGVLMCILALENLIKFFEADVSNKVDSTKKKYKYLIYAGVLMFIANCSYQGIIGLFIALCLVYILKYSKSLKQFVLNNIIVSLVYGIPALADYLTVKLLFKSSRINGEIVLFESFKKIGFNLGEMTKYMYNLLPKYTFILAILFTFSVFWCKIFKEKGRVLQFLKILYIIIGITFIAVIPQIAQATGSIWFVPRATYCFASLYGILILYLFMNYELKKTGKIAIIIVSITLLMMQLSRFIQIEKDRYILNEKDKQITNQIIEQIHYYEEHTGNTIEEISIYQDERPNYTYSGIFATGDTNVKCYASDWSTVAILNYYLNRNLKIIDKDEKIVQKFANKNWDEFDEEQILFEDSKLILCNY